MASFLLKDKRILCIQATEICFKDDFITAWLNKKRVAIFHASEVIGCWLDGSDT